MRHAERAAHGSGSDDTRVGLRVEWDGEKGVIPLVFTGVSTVGQCVVLAVLDKSPRAAAEAELELGVLGIGQRGGSGWRVTPWEHRPSARVNWLRQRGQ